MTAMSSPIAAMMAKALVLCALLSWSGPMWTACDTCEHNRKYGIVDRRPLLEDSLEAGGSRQQHGLSNKQLHTISCRIARHF